MSFCVLIPARLASTRLPRKVLLDVGGVPMIEQVRRRALESGAAQVV
ncbi:MAG: cytidylyltransferase domain-containing protein, partial [Acidithiobacillus sp.]